MIREPRTHQIPFGYMTDNISGDDDDDDDDDTNKNNSNNK